MNLRPTLTLRATASPDPRAALEALRTACRFVDDSTDASCGLRQVLERAATSLRADAMIIYAALTGGSVKPILWYSPSFEWDCEAGDSGCRAVYATQIVSGGLPAVADVDCRGRRPKAGPAGSPRRPARCSIIGVPIRSKGTIVGALLAEAYRPGAFGQGYLATMEPLATVIGLALENSIISQQVNEQYHGFRSVVESINEGLVLVEGDKVAYCSHRALELCGLKAEELEQAGVALLHGRLAESGDHPEEVLRHLDENAGGRKRWTMVFERRGPEHRKYRLEGFPIEGPDGEPVGHGYVIRDVTEELEIDRIKSELISVVSHELVTPITTIKGLATTLSRQDVQWAPEQRKEFVSDIVDETDRLQELIANILETTRLETGVFHPDLALVRIDRMVRRCLDVARRRFPLADVAEGSLEEGLEWVLDARGIERVLLSLVDNAVKYSQGRPWVRISAYRRLGRLAFQVSDHGIGIDPTERERVFQKFFRSGNPDVRRVRGTGLGLAIAKGIVEAHGGSIWLEAPHVGESEPGTTIAFEMPFRETDEEGDDHEA